MPDPGLTGEVNFNHCLYEILYLTFQARGMRGEAEQSLCTVKSERANQLESGNSSVHHSITVVFRLYPKFHLTQMRFHLW